MEQIAAEADVAKATLYNHFAVKEALLAHRFREDIAAGMVQRASVLASKSGFDARMRYLLSESAAWHTERKAYLAHYLRFLTSQASYGQPVDGQSHTHSDTWQILAYLFRAGQASGEIITEFSAEEIAWHFQYLLFAAMAAWLVDPRRDLKERFLAAFDFAMNGVAQAATATIPDHLEGQS